MIHKRFIQRHQVFGSHGFLLHVDAAHKAAPPVWQWGQSTVAVVQSGPQAEMKNCRNTLRHLQTFDCPFAFALTSSTH